MNKPTQPKVRFPENVIKIAMLKIEATESDQHPKAEARLRGENAARQWILSIFGLVVCEAHQKTPGYGIALSWEATKPTKLEFARLMCAVIERFTARYAFDNAKGTVQVNGKSLSDNEAYGFWDQLHTLMERFDLWTLLDKQGVEPPASPLQVRRTTRRQDGECNFCPSQDHDVFEIRSGDEHRTLAVRCCRACILAIREQTKSVS